MKTLVVESLKEGKDNMKKNRKSELRKERTIMIASSAFVLAALTLTGVYMRQQSARSKDDGYSIDFTAFEDSGPNKAAEIAQGNQEETTPQGVAVNSPGKVASVVEDDLDYMPIEGLAGEDVTEKAKAMESPLEADVTDNQDISENQPVVVNQLHFSESDKLLVPLAEAEVLMPYSMEGSIYFKTLDQYKYNPAIIYAAEEGTLVQACGAGEVIAIYDTPKQGHTLILSLGDGYQAVYGQMKDIEVTVGSLVEPGAVLGAVAAPTKYYSLEGANLYFELQKDGKSVDPNNYFS